MTGGGNLAGTATAGSESGRFFVATTVDHRRFRARSSCMIISVSTGRRPSFELMERIDMFPSPLLDLTPPAITLRDLSHNDESNASDWG